MPCAWPTAPPVFQEAEVPSAKTEAEKQPIEESDIGQRQAAGIVVMEGASKFDKQIGGQFPDGSHMHSHLHHTRPGLSSDSGHRSGVVHECWQVALARDMASAFVGAGFVKGDFT